jgi:hypothetical protein
VLRGKLLGQCIPVETPRIVTTFMRVFGANLLAGCGFVALANLCQTGRTPLGYPIVMYHAVLYGILLGTNSFGIPAPIRFAPSLTTVLNRSGAFEITAYIAIAAATRGLVITTSITTSRYCGEINTRKLLCLARARCAELGLSKAVIASETGRGALAAVRAFEGTGTRLIVVTHYPATTWGPEGEIPIGLKRETYAGRLERLLGSGAVVVQGTRPFAPPTHSIDWDNPMPEAVVDKTLEVLGAGFKIAIEVALIAADAGEVAEGEEVVTCAGTYKGLDTALVVRATTSMRFFRNFEVCEIVARPRCRVREFPEYEHANWRGDLEPYYEAT